MMTLEGVCLALKPKEYLKFWRLESLSKCSPYNALIDKLLAMDDRLWRIWGIGETALGVWLYSKKSK